MTIGGDRLWLDEAHRRRPVTARTPKAAVAGLVLFAVFAVLFLGGALSAGRRDGAIRAGPSDPHPVRPVSPGHPGTRWSPWSGVVDVRRILDGSVPAVRVLIAPSSADRFERHAPRWLLGAEDKLARPTITVRDLWPAADPELVERTLQHYLLNPAHRAELGGSTAPDRIGQGRLFHYRR
ncbi:hypothetical protein AB0G04_22510 [Actinoplanes sp. NPDC023801]|uniref:hypothetical protein n=1 Tax=Actinoplanes sp. NPDC023801 TaxID=3154595 RepID=UPI0033C7CABD